MNPHKYFLHTYHILPKYSPYYCPTWALTNISYISPINYLAPSHKYYPLYLTYCPTWIFTKTLITLLSKLGHIIILSPPKKPKIIYLVGKTQKAQQNSPKTHCYTAPLKPFGTRHLQKPVVTWHHKARYYTTPLKTRCYTVH